eukprot:CAMPEP_0119160454 /NCGR_PEP_ID=MMETSP1315-20130426/400_1 /TAXON_ID=676789 /ORGANISM="Prasinoderma singularis, Strain RCC927" /LENGTH=63 /DNA_ID=CAMNT_0007153109 /DNA_START=30 /DNA_END=221 /DNA_ORIENTATION=+
MVYPKSWSMLRVAGAEAVRLWPFVVGFGVMNVAVCSLVAGLDDETRKKSKYWDPYQAAKSGGH